MDILDKVTELFDMPGSLSEKQKKVLNEMPDTRENIADTLEMSYRAVRYHMNEIDEKYASLERNSNAVWSISEEDVESNGSRDVVDEETDSEQSENHSNISGSSNKQTRQASVKRINTYDKAQATKDINNELLEIEKEVVEAVNRLPVNYPEYKETKGSSTLVIPRCDDHFGVKVQGRSINSKYSTPIARKRVNTIVNDAIEKSRERGDVENVVVPFLGDIIDGENVYPGHEVNLRDFMNEQIKKATSVYLNQIEKLSEEFEHVKIPYCPGNHANIGTISNADDIIYNQIEMGVELLDIENVSFVRNNSAYVEFDIRGYKAYGRHGDDALEHASTSSGDDRWMNWKEEVDFDLAYHGHHHQLRMEPVGHGQVFQCGTLVPPSLFVNKIGSTGVPRAMYHFTTDENAVEDMNIIEF
jgi:hypothetical protein